jgi:ABC-type transport system substrate-binding protein
MYSNRKFSRRFLYVFSVVLMAGLVLMGCQPVATPIPAEPSSPTEEAAVSTQAPTQMEPTAKPAEQQPTEVAPEPEEAKVLTIAASAEITSFDSGEGGDFQNYALNLLMFHNLLEQDEKGEVHPVLAESYSVADDNVTWTFNLKQGIQFSDGTPFTSEAVCFTVDQLIAEDSAKAHASTWSPVGSCNTVDDYTVQLVTKEPYAPFIGSVVSAGYAGQILSPSMGEFGDEAGQHPIGTGPYQLKEWIRGDRVVLERNPNYSEILGPKPYFDEIVWRIIPEDTTRILALQNGEVDFAYKVPAELYGEVNTDPNINVLSVPGLWQWYLINVTVPPLDNMQVRKALNYAIDKQTIIDTLLEGRATIAEGAVGSSFDGFVPVGTYEYDPELAHQMLDEAGALGSSIRVLAPSGRYPGDSTVAEAVVAQLQEVGLNAELEVMGDWPAYMETIWSDVPMIAFLGWQPTDVSRFYLRTITCDAGNWNLGPICDPELDNLVAEASSELNPEQRKEIMTDLQNVVFDQALGLFMYNVNLDYGVNQGVEGIYIQPNSMVHFRGAQPSP